MANQPVGEPDRAGVDMRAATAFAIIVILGGGNAIAIKFGLRELDPFWSAALRFLIAGALLSLIVLIARKPLPRGRALQGVVIFGALNFGLTFAFAYYALTELSAGTIQVVLSLVPMVVVILTGLQHVEALSGRALAGAATATAGTAIVFYQSLGVASPLALGAALCAVLCLGQAAVTIKRFPRVSPLVENAIGQSVGGLILLVLSILAGETFAVPTESATLLSLGFLIVFGSMLLFGLYVFIIEIWTASAASYVLVIMPIFTILYAAVLLDERVTLSFLFGSAAILAGLYIGVLRHGHSHPTGPH